MITAAKVMSRGVVIGMEHGITGDNDRKSEPEEMSTKREYGT